MDATTILLARHGETDWNAERRVQGHTDRPLNGTGIAQARALAEELSADAIDAVYSSDLERAQQTAEVVADARGLPVETLPELRERDFGTWEGLTDEEVFERFPDARSGPWGDAESRDELGARILEACKRIASRHPGGSVLVVTHGGPVRAMLTYCGADGVGAIANCQVARLVFRDGEFTAED